jgi:hypothetical protein
VLKQVIGYYSATACTVTVIMMGTWKPISCCDSWWHLFHASIADVKLVSVNFSWDPSHRRPQPPYSYGVRTPHSHGIGAYVDEGEIMRYWYACSCVLGASGFILRRMGKYGGFPLLLAFLILSACCSFHRRAAFYFFPFLVIISITPGDRCSFAHTCGSHCTSLLVVNFVHICLA